MSRLFFPELLTSKMKGIRSQGSARGEGDKFDSTDKAEDFTHALSSVLSVHTIHG